MENIQLPLNPWLKNVLRSFRSKIKQTDLSLQYQIAIMLDLNATWIDFIAGEALFEAMKEDPFLRTECQNMELPDEIKSFLYHLISIDYVADLMQFTREELRLFTTFPEFSEEDIGLIDNYLKKHGKKLKNGPVSTRKLPSGLVYRNLAFSSEDCEMTKAVKNPDSVKIFNIERISSSPSWVDGYYKEYLHIEGEEQLCGKLKAVRLKRKHNDLPDVFSSFFKAVGCFWDSFKKICDSESIEYDIPLYYIPLFFDFENDIILSQRKAVVKALVYLFEQRNLFCERTTPSDYLTASDEGKLDIAEVQEQNSAFQELLITFVEVSIDFYSIVDTLEAALNKQSFLISDYVRIPADEWLNGMLKVYRKKCSNEYLHNSYLQMMKGHPDMKWSDFLIYMAMLEAINSQEYTHNQDEIGTLPQPLEDYLAAKDYERVRNYVNVSVDEFAERLGVIVDD